MNATIPELITRRPTGKPPHPLLLVAGVEKAGKSYGGAAFSASDLIDRTFWIEIGEGAADQYGSIPGARYEIVQHDGTYTSICNSILAATAQPRNGKPHAIVVDSMTELWDLLSDEAQATANKRARAKALENKKPVPTGDAQITMDLWNAAKKRWRRIIDALRTYDGPVILLARLELVGVVDAKGKPDPNGAREWKIRAEKNLPFECDAIVKMTAPQTAVLTGVRSTVLFVPPGSELPLPSFTIDGLLRKLGLDVEGATSQRSYTAPQVEDVDALELDGPDRPMTRQPRGGQADDEWTKPGPPKADPKDVDHVIGGLRAVRGITEGAAGMAAIVTIVGHPLANPYDLTPEEVAKISATLRAEDEAARANRRMHVLFKERGIRDSDSRHAFAARIVEHEVTDTSALTQDEVQQVIAALNSGELPAPAEAPPTEGLYVDVLAEQIRVCGSSDDLAELGDIAWRANESGTITQPELTRLMDLSMEREQQLAHRVGASA